MGYVRCRTSVCQGCPTFDGGRSPTFVGVKVPTFGGGVGRGWVHIVVVLVLKSNSDGESRGSGLAGFAGVGKPHKRVLIVGELLRVLGVVGPRGCVESQCGVAGSLSRWCVMDWLVCDQRMYG